MRSVAASVASAAASAPMTPDFRLGLTDTMSASRAGDADHPSTAGADEEGRMGSLEGFGLPVERSDPVVLALEAEGVIAEEPL